MHHFSAGGLFNGLVLLIDDETRTYWDHITGEAVHGPLAGTRLDTWGVDFTTVRAALRDRPELRVSRPRQTLKSRAMGFMHRKQMGTRGFIPPPFRRTMQKTDPRLPELAQGVGVYDDTRARFYPMERLGTQPRQEPWGDAHIQVWLDPDSGAPRAELVDAPEDTHVIPIFSRWYGFALTFPECEIGPVSEG